MTFDGSESQFVINDDQLRVWRQWQQCASSVGAESRSADCIVFTFSRVEPADQYTTRIGGLPAWTKSAAWPVCRQCDEWLAFVAQLDFRESSLRDKLPGDVLLFHYCFLCWPSEASKTGWEFTWVRTDGKELISERIIPGQI